MTEAVTLRAVTASFDSGRVDRALPAGGTIADLMRASGIDPAALRAAHVFVDDWRIPPDRWHVVRPKPGRTLIIRVRPGGGGDGGKNPLRTILSIAVLAASAFVGGLPAVAALGAFGQAAVTAGIGLVGSLLVNALAPPPSPNLGRLSGRQESPTYSITGQANRANPYGPVPFVAGRHRIFPPYGAKPYSELVGNDQFFRLLFLPGYGPLDLSEFKIGATPLEQFEGVETEVRQGFPGDAPLTLFSRDIDEEPLSILLAQAESWTVRRTLVNVDEISIDITFAQGLVSFDDKGDRQSATVQVAIEISPADANDWTSVATLTVTDRKASAVRRGHRWAVARGQYDVRLRRVTADTASDRVFDKVYWSAFRSIRATDPVLLPGVAKIAVRIKATEQLNGQVDQFSLVAHSILPDWDEATGTWIERATSQPAALHRAMLQHPANKRPLADGRIALDELAAWDVRNRAGAREFNAVFDTPGTVRERLAAIAAAGDAALAQPGGRYSIVEDMPQPTKVQLFTPRNSWDFKFTTLFPEVPHAIRVRFINPAVGWEMDERIVYADGHDETTASVYEVLELFGETDPDRAWRRGRRHLAEMIHRRGPYEITTDPEWMAAGKGAMVGLSHDAAFLGLGQGRIKAVTVDGAGDATAIRLDDLVAMEVGKTYAVEIRRDDMEVVKRAVATAPGETDTLTFALPVPAIDAPAVGDLVAFGETDRVSVAAVIKAIAPAPGHNARLTLIDAAPQIFDAADGPIPPWQSQITLPPGFSRPFVTAVRSDESVLVRAADGSLTSRILVELGRASSAATGITGIQAQYRLADVDSGAEWTPMPLAAADASEVSIAPVEDGESYDLRLRYVRAAGPPSAWVTLRHQVTGQDGLPADPTGFRINVLGDRANLSIDRHPAVDWSYWIVKHTPSLVDASWGTSTLLVDRLGTDSVQVPAMVGTYLIKAVDRGGRESAGAAMIVSTIAGREDVNVVEESPQHPIFAGAKDRVAVVDGRLQLESADTMADWTSLAAVSSLAYGETGLETEGVYEFDEIVDLGAVYTSRVSATVVARGTNLLDSIAAWASLAEVEAMSAVDPSAYEVTVEISTTEDDPAGAPVWTAWEPLTVGDYRFRARQLRARLRSRQPAVTPQVSVLSDLIDMPDRILAGDDVAVPAGGMRIAFAPPYRALKGLSIAAQDLASGDRPVITAKDETGFDIRFVDAAGAGIARTFDYVADGYGRRS